MRKKKIAHVLHCVGGVETYLRLILTNINPDKFDQLIIHGKKDTKSGFYDKNGTPLKDYNIPVEREISLIKDIQSVILTCRILKRERPDVIHCHSAKGGIIGRLAGYLLKIPVFYTPNAFSYLSTENKFKRFIYLSIEKIFANRNSILLSSSLSEEKNGIQEVGYQKEKTILFSNSINPIDHIQPLSIPKTWPDEYICTVGRPSYQKNIECMIRVLYEVNKTRKLHLVLMGVGHHSDKLQSVQDLIHELDLSQHVTMLPWTDRENIFNIIKNAKFYISTSRYEGLPYSVIESLALSIPCLVSDCDGNVDLIQNGYNGYVVAQNNVSEFTEKVHQMLSDSNLLSSFAQNAHASFLENYNMNKNILRLENIYQQAN